MVNIFYKNGEHQIMRVVPSLEKAAEALENLWKARIEAVAKNKDSKEVGAVWKNDGELTWFCFTNNKVAKKAERTLEKDQCCHYTIGRKDICTDCMIKIKRG